MDSNAAALSGDPLLSLAPNGSVIAPADLFPAAFLAFVLLGAMLMPVLVYLVRKLPRMLWYIIVSVAEMIRDEVIKAILVALAASTGLAGLLHCLGIVPLLR